MQDLRVRDHHYGVSQAEAVTTAKILVTGIQLDLTMARAANGTVRAARTAAARRGSPGACSARSTKSAPTRSIVPVSAAPSRRINVTGARSRATPRNA